MGPIVAAVSSFTELVEFYVDPPPGVRANMIFSADGAAAFGGRAGPLSGTADQLLLQALRSFADVVFVGAGTARAEDYGPARLTEEQKTRRRAEGRSDPPPIAVVSRTGALPARLFSDPDQLPILVTCGRGAVDPGDNTLSRVFTAGQATVDVPDAVRMLTEAGMPRILCEGGPSLLDALVQAGAVDEICVTIAPKLAANQPVRSDAKTSSLPQPAGMHLDHVLVHQEYVFLKYSRRTS